MKNKRKVLTVLIVLTLVFIWGNSLFDSNRSADESGFVVRFLEFFFGQGNVSEHFVRKLAHFMEYALLGAELLAYFGSYPMAAAHGLFTAFVDETLQYFSPGRSAEVKDIWLDLAGAATGALVMLLILKLRKNKDKK